MTTILFFDTETTGFVDTKAYPTAPQQPHMLELAWVLRSDAKLTSRGNIYIDWNVPIPQKAESIHGISREFLVAHGVTPRAALALFTGLLRKADVIAGHNLEFDLKVLECAIAKIDGEYLEAHEKLLATKLTYCTMKTATPVCCIPARNGKPGYKWPTLMEAHQFFLSRSFEGAHGALSDIEATVRVYDALQTYGKS